ncbi:MULTISPECIES: 3,4-dihydroxy-2-butanone-4-phosphate synthase [Enterobacteriaceae]|jgi:3,4-dihydroxy-2-butanone 4-phosphate synthase|uniref:3,4-dihydroxy-2-butanone 4-phosphate synthase n=2 Tax=Kluyvera TaxID=579 RepID=A0A3N2RU14_9ENTR|nr:MULTISPECIES: 3,4-dihydroxy-2-butanone-4-phosphate synthase [Enterobacteriaceae]BBV64251.1 3,4-dihydroxy-2-butanone 4-phosphate synthase [Klebsiella sp. STW0522-44]HEB4872655.1 3,4-dihydroxy-2-butanone-4-phosphate synthase [Kluyvera ascorbata F0526]EJG2387664.1 3,4-dihydroxy-2-butanone-4-phosphate synthase [Kluyvera ascorbata]KFD05139.1 3,4-dihydroxy-2-butanone 4-phosphate synthase [Kluyvera ascorbata ATCC 33433]MDT8699697.1 3,4-dihydroxy-2-butanone-4-phosphate synthase [Kluyvera ascorbata]
MNQTLLSSFGTPFERVENALIALREGRGAMVLDDEDRENEGDMIFAAENMTVEQMALTIRHGSGIVCLCLTDERRKQLDLPMMVENNTSAYGTGFTVTIEAAHGVTTGVSAADRLTTVRAAIADNAKPSDLNRPGHVFPLRAQPGGVLTRGGHTEATIDLVSLAGFKPAGVLCELTNDDGTMARAPECIKFAKEHNMALVTIEDLVAYRREHERKAS